MANRWKWFAPPYGHNQRPFAEMAAEAHAASRQVLGERFGVIPDPEPRCTICWKPPHDGSCKG